MHQPARSESASSSGCSPEKSRSPTLAEASLDPENPRGTPEPDSYWSLSGRTRGPRRTRWLLLVPVRAERPTLMSLLRVLGATESAVVCEGTGVSPHTGPDCWSQESRASGLRCGHSQQRTSSRGEASLSSEKPLINRGGPIYLQLFRRKLTIQPLN